MAGKARERQALDRNRELADNYRKIGITAVAAAVEYQGPRSTSTRGMDESDRSRSRQSPKSSDKPRGS
jgi:hypothetical protein